MNCGATDDFGFRAVENPVRLHDLHATIFRLPGHRPREPTYRYGARDFRLTDLPGRAIVA